ncbi:hypothetical protein Cgig2_016799 [Carnegiea gigantea]|uniref:Uncharacterized protein n=1 Tax=Carnegiea gigantea TaxID=171969 RepID=A0A9Q1GX53_9CARY|nr:hypothetical protein Cgig2_016799 [Carnegiea gigantea]
MQGDEPKIELMEDSAPLRRRAWHSLSDFESDVEIGEFLESRPKRACDDLESEKGDFGSWVWAVQQLVREVCQSLETRWLSEQRQNEFLPHETQRRERLCFSFVEAKPEQSQDEILYENLCRAIRVIVRKQAELPHKTQRSSPRTWCDLPKGWVRHYDAVNCKPKHGERPHETQRTRRLLWAVDDSRWLRQEVRLHEPLIQQIRVVITELDPINHNHKTTTKSVLLNGHGWEYVSTYDTMATGGTQQKTAIGPYLCSPANQHSKCNNNYSQSPPNSGNQKDEDPWKGNREEDKDPNGGTTVVTIRGEDQKSGHSYNSSFASAQFSTLALSSLLLCLMVLFPNFAQKNQAITAAALMGATLGSLVSLETILKCPSLARSCGYFAIISLLVAIGSILSTSVNWVTI